MKRPRCPVPSDPGIVRVRNPVATPPTGGGFAPGLALLAGGIFPGVLTAPFLIVVAAWLAVLLRREHGLPYDAAV